MSIRINLNNALKESAVPDEPQVGGESQLDAIMTDIDLEELMNEVNPISGEVAVQIQEQTANPDNLRIICDESAENFYIDYSELREFCEASGSAPEDAMKTIVEHYSKEFPKITTESFSIVFPSKEIYMEACTPDHLGFLSVKQSYDMLRTCKDAGLKVSTFPAPGLLSTLK